MTEKPKKISELPQIQNISNDDLLLVSDYDNGACLSKKMTIEQIVQYVIDAVVKSSKVKNQIKQQATSIATAVAQEVVDEQIDDKTMQIVEKNIDDICDLLDGVKDSQFLIDGGGSGAK